MIANDIVGHGSLLCEWTLSEGCAVRERTIEVRWLVNLLDEKELRRGNGQFDALEAAL